LIDIGIEPYLISSSLMLVGAQRLVRRLCSQCKEAYETTSKLMDDFKIKQDLLYKPKGCDYCSHTGYRGRIGVYEIVVIGDKMRELISQSASLREVRAAIIELGARSLLENGIKKVEEGVTSIEEVLSITIITEE
ncbi:type II/IV secretion system protein, partial [Candidatus Omnitrophota bacterium]